MAAPDRFDADDLVRHGRFVKALARELARDDDEAAELAARAMAEAVARRPETGAGLRAWLRTVLSRLASRSRRESGRRARRERAAFESTGAPDRVAPSTVDLVARIELEHAIAAAFAQLEEPYQRTLFLRFFDDRTPTWIAAEQGVPVETVKTRLKRGLAKLRVALDAQHGSRGVDWRATAIAWSSGGAPVFVLAKAKGIAVAATVALLVGAAAWMQSRRSVAPDSASNVADLPAAAATRIKADEAIAEPDVAAAQALPHDESARRTEEELIPFASGFVVDEHGTPIEGARVVASCDNAFFRKHPEASARMNVRNPASPLDFSCIDGATLARTDPDGRFRVPSAPDCLAGFYFVADGFGPSSCFDLSAIASENQGLRVTLARGCIARGRIHDREGRPVLGASVVATDYEPKVNSVVPSAHPLAPLCTGPDPRNLAQISIVDADGRFELPLPRHDCRITAGSMGYVDAMEDYEPDAGEADLVLWRSQALLDVVDARSRAAVPTVHALVVRMDRPEFGSFILPMQFTNRIAPNVAQCEYPSLPARLVVPSSASLVLFADGYRSKTYELAIDPAGEPPHETIALEPGEEPPTIEGVVHGARAARVELRWIRHQERSELEARIARVRQELQPDDVDTREAPLAVVDTDRDGRFAFRGMPPGTYCIDVAAKDRAPRRRVLTAPVRDLSFDLAASAQLEVTVVDADGAPCAGACVHVQTALDARAWSMGTSRDGLARFSRLPDADLRLVAARELQGNGVTIYERCAFSPDDDVTLAAGETRRVTLKIIEPVSVTLFVHDVELRPIEGANIAISIEHSSIPGVLLTEEQRALAGRIFETDVDGEVHGELLPSNYVFEVWAHGHHFHSHVGLGRERSRRIDLPLADD